MDKFVNINYKNIEKNEQIEEIVKLVINECFKKEKLQDLNIYISITLTNNTEITKINKEFRNINKETDVLSFPMFEKSELDQLKKQKYNNQKILGDIIISIDKVKKQAKEYEHSFKRELSYMIVHGFYHLMGYDHMEEKSKQKMRKKEKKILNKLNITR